MRVSFTVPTLNRPETHRELYAGFVADLVKDSELVILDESKDPSPFFSALEDPRVRYFHEPGKPREGGVTRIGAARNRLTELARGEFIFHRDDDDVYGEQWTTHLLEHLRDADFVKSVKFRISHRGLLFEWDLRQFGGQHWAIRGADIALTHVDPKESGPDGGPAIADAFLVGFGWSYAYRRELALKFPFPTEGTEDIPWVRAIRAAGARIKLLDDCAHLAIHVAHVDPNHPQGGSPHFPQRLLGAAGADRLRAWVQSRMMGAASVMQELPEGKSIRIEPGAVYSVLASLKKSTSLKGLASRADQWGVTITEARDDIAPEEFGVPAPPDGYRLVHVQGSSPTAVTLPWRVPSPLSVFDKSSIVRAWTSAPLGAGMARESGLLLGVDRGPLGAGAGAGPPGFTALLQGEPAANSAWNQVQAQLSAEGNTDTYDAQSDFLSAYGELAYTTTQTDPTTIANAAGQFVIMGRTVAGAVSGVGGLLAAAASGSMTPQAAGQFTGMLVSGATSLAISTGIVTAGVGAAIVAGVTLAIDLLETLFPNNVVTQVGACGLSSKPNILVGSVWSQSGLVVAAGPGPKSIYWRRFPNPQNSADSAWFALPQPPSNQAGGFQWTSGASTDTWQPCSMNMPGGRNIDLAWPTYRQLECEAAAADGSPFAQFQLAFFAAWKASQEYALNGLYAQPDYQVLLQTLRFWNAAHSSSSTMQLQARSGSPISPTVGFAFNATLSPCSSSIVPYASLLVSQIATSAASDPNYNAAANAIVINTGPLLQPVIASDLVSQTVVPQLPNAIFPGASTAKMTTYAFGIPAALAVSAAAYGYFVKKDVWYVFKAAGGALKDGGQTLAGAHVPGLGAAERRSKRYERCVRKVKKRGSAVNPWAVCTKSVGR